LDIFAKVRVVVSGVVRLGVLARAGRAAVENAGLGIVVSVLLVRARQFVGNVVRRRVASVMVISKGWEEVRAQLKDEKLWF
jgi:hypothetical protein